MSVNDRKIMNTNKYGMPVSFFGKRVVVVGTGQERLNGMTGVVIGPPLASWKGVSEPRYIVKLRNGEKVKVKTINLTTSPGYEGGGWG